MRSASWQRSSSSSASSGRQRTESRKLPTFNSQVGFEPRRSASLESADTVPHIGRAAMVNAGLALTAVMLLFAMERVTGRIPVNEGRGWDGVDYSNMLNRWDRGT